MCLVVVQDGAGYRGVEPDILALLCWSLSQSQADNNQLTWHTNDHTPQAHTHALTHTHHTHKKRFKLFYI